MADFEAEINVNTGEAKTKSKSSSKSDGSSAFAGGFIGSILGDLLSSVKSLFDPLSAIATLLVAALFPLLKPFLILFLKVGMLLIKWLNGAVAGLTGGGPATIQGTDEAGNSIIRAGEGLSGALFAAGAILVGTILAVATGLTVGWIAALAVLGGIIISKVGTVFIDMLLNVFSWIDTTFGTNFIEPISKILGGFTDVFQGIYETFVALLELDFTGVWEGLKKVFNGFGDMFEGVWDFFIEMIKTSFTKVFNLFGNDFGTWLWDSITNVFTTAFNFLDGIGEWIRNKITGLFGFGGGSETSVNDAIITPNGDIIRTNPNDYLIATKTPESFGGMGGSGKGTTVNVNINGGLITEDVARDISRIIQRELNLGGGF